MEGIVADRPETEEKFRVFFRESGMYAYYGLLLQDEEGKLAVLGFESRETLQIDEERRDLVQILVNQATVAVRNAQLYQQVPLSGFLKPLLERRQRLAAIPLQRRRAWAIAAAITLVLLFIVPWSIRVAGPTRILPGRRVAVTAEVEGAIRSVERREGDIVRAGDVIAVLQEDDYQAALAHADAAFRIAESNVARYRQENDVSAMSQALAQRDENALRMALARENLSRARLKAPAAGVILTPHLEDRIGQVLAKGAEFCVLADVATVTAEVAVPEADASLLKRGQQVALKLNPYPTRVFRGLVTRIGAEIHQEGEERFVIAESQVENPDGAAQGGDGRSRKSRDRHADSCVRSRAQARAVPLDEALARSPVSLVPRAARRSSSLLSATRPEEKPRRAQRTARRARGPAGARPGLVVRRQVQMGDVHIVVKNPETLRVFIVEEDGWALLQLFNGERTRLEIVDEYNRLNPGADLTLKIVLEYEEMAQGMGILEQSATERNLRLLSEVKKSRRRAAEEKAEGFNPFFMLFKVFDPDPLLNRTVRYVRWIGRPPPWPSPRWASPSRSLSSPRTGTRSGARRSSCTPF